MRALRHLWTCPFAALLISCGGQSDFSWRTDDRSAALLRDENVVWQFRYGDEVPKPMFHPLSLADGAQLTWDAPPDHPWHHALWFSWKYLNGVNYWEEDRETGKSAGVTGWRNVRVTTRPEHSARIEMQLDYHPPGEPPVLTERRVIEVSTPEENGTYHLDWAMEFTAGDEDVDINRTPIVGEEDGKSWGGYAGLSIRFAKDLTGWKTVSDQGPLEPDEASATNFCKKGPMALDFSGVIQGRAAGVALLDHPANLNSPTPWYICMNPKNSFGFSEAALIYYKPHLLRAGESLRLRYRVVVHEGRWGAAELQSAQQEFVKELEVSE